MLHKLLILLLCMLTDAAIAMEAVKLSCPVVAGPHSGYSYFSEKEKALLLQTFLTSEHILDENQNNVLHMAAALTEYPELTQELLLNQPELASCLDAANKNGVTPRALMDWLQNPKIAQPLSQTVTMVTLSPDWVDSIDKSIAAKMMQRNPTYTQYEKIRIIKHILEMRPSSGKTALHLAAGVQGFPELTQFLLSTNPQLKAVINLPDDEGYTALDLANIKENPSAVAALKAAGALDL